MLGGAYDGILERISRAAFVQFDESVVRMNGKRRYVWLVTTGDAAYLVAAPGRVAAVLELHFGGLLDMPTVAYGYVYMMCFRSSSAAGSTYARPRNTP